MRCSNCSKVVKPVVALDIDGTLGDYHGHILKFALDYLGLPVTFLSSNYNGIDNFGDWFTLALGIDRRTYRDIKLAYRQGGQKRMMPAYDFADELTRLLKKEGAEIWLTTTRPYLRLDSVDPDTRHWLDRNGVQYDALLYDKDKYKVLSERVDKDRVVMILDDLSGMISQAEAMFGDHVPVLRRTHWNRAIAYDHMAGSLNSAYKEASVRIAEWRRRNES